jgi:formylglycine-generating enzyme required for sulfatase activity
MASIGDPEECPPYGGLSIRPQLGLLPIGRDPHSRLWEFVHLQSGNPPERNPDGSLLITAETGIILVLIPGGSFWFGAQSQDREGPNYDPHVDRDLELREETVQPFFLSKYEMTQGQWLRATGNNPSLVWAGSIKGGNMTTLLHPVESVTLSECSRVLGRFGLRLPDDVQWDRAARGGVEQDWWVEVVREQRTDLGNLADLAYGRYASNEPYDSWFDDGFALHAPVGRFLPNPYGLCDVVGNVYEWIQSTSQLGISGDVADRSGADRTALMKTPTFYRGGAFINQASIVGIGAGGSFSPETREYWLGVRPARLLDQ